MPVNNLIKPFSYLIETLQLPYRNPLSYCGLSPHAITLERFCQAPPQKNYETHTFLDEIV